MTRKKLYKKYVLYATLYTILAVVVTAIFEKVLAKDPVEAVEATGGGADQFGSCITWNQLGMDDPGTAASAVFDYNNTAIAFAAGVYTVTATRIPVAGPAPGGDTIAFAYTVATGATTRTGTGPYSGLK